MIPNIQGILLSAEFKGIPASILEPQEFIDKVVPKGFDDIIQTSTDGFDVFLNQIHLDGTLSDNDILITKTVYTSDNVVFPKFAITNLSNNTYILNQNQILHLMLTYRFNQFRTMTRFYMNLISKDVASVMRYVQYVLPHSYNTKIKINNSVCFMVFKDMGIVSSEFSEWFASSRVTEAQWKTIFAQHNISLSSVGSMQKSDTVVINPEPTNQLYRSVGYWETDKGFISIFPPSQNVPARHQSHTIGECYKLLDSSQSVFQQDNVIVDGKLQRKDNCLREAIIVFHPTTETNEFLSGEIEASLDVANQLVEVKYNIEDCISQLYVSKGQTVYPDFKDYLLADSLLGQQIILKDFKQFTVVDIETTGINSSRKIRITGLKRAGNARIISNTGLKGVTKVVNNLGVIKFYPSTESSFEEQVKERIQSDNWLKELKERYPNTDFDSLDEYPPIEKEHFHEIKPDMICGMNSVKAKSNTIVLARAALAVKLGYYVPSEKFGFKGLLDTLDENEINTASQALPDFIYLDKNGNQVKVEIGLVYVTYTELTSIYTRVKPQSFSFEAGRNLALDGSSSNALYKYIWDNYLDKELVEMSQELYKILMLAETGTFNNQDQLPVYNLEEINKIFTQNDLVLSSRNEFPSESKLLDESFNQGFFIDLSKYQNAPVIRIPSAKSLKMFSGVLKNGNTIYHPNLISVSKIIRGCLKVNNSYALNTIYSKDKSRTTSALAYNSYINTIQATLFSTPEVSQQVIQSLIKPEIMGCSFKMVNEPLLPDNVVLITDDSVFNRLKTEALKGSDSTLEDYQVKLVYLSSKYDSLSKDEKTELFEELNKDCPFGLAMRNPQLWKTMVMKVKIWDRFMYELYLKLFHDLTIDKVMNTHYNRDVLLCSPNISIVSHADNDGDLLPVSVLDYKGQQLLRNFEFEHVLDEELLWHKMYYDKEYKSTYDLEKQHVYKLHLITYKEYSKYLLNASVAKGAVGSSTLDIWSFSMMLEIYQKYYTDNNGIYTKKTGKSAMTPLSKKELELLSHMYSRIVQTFVIEGIKHMENGSKDFEPYQLQTIGKQENERKVRTQLRETFGLDPAIIDKLLFIVRFASDNNNLLKACRNFISKYNKGRQPLDTDALDYWEEYIANNTYFGSLLKPIFDIKTSYQKDIELQTEKLSNLFNSDMFENIVFE